MDKEELLAKLDGLGIETDEQRNAVVCALIGHSVIREGCCGYIYCARCGAQVGDSLGSIYHPPENQVLVGCDCQECWSNYETLDWKDKLFVGYPFKPVGDNDDRLPADP